MSRTMIVKLAGACALAMAVTSGALAHGGGMAGASIGSHMATPSPVGSSRLSAVGLSPIGKEPTTVGSGMPVSSARRPTPVTGTRLSPIGKTPIVIGSSHVQVDPPPPRGADQP